jgi:hypothetical protein
MKNFQLRSVFALFLLVVITAFSACKDEDDDTVQPITPTVTITSPTEGQEVKANQTVTITGTIVAPETLHGYIIYIRKKADNSEIFKKEIHDHKTEITISEPWTVDAVTGHTELELEIVGTLDHAGNTVSKKVSFHAMP